LAFALFATIAALENSRSDEVENQQQELAWREFYQHAMYNFPELATGAYRQVLKNFPYGNNEEHFQACVRVEPATPSLMLLCGR